MKKSLFIVVIISILCQNTIGTENNIKETKKYIGMDFQIFLKVIAAISLFIIALIGGAIPVYWKKIRDSPVVMSHVGAFSGGIFLAMAFSHLLPESVEVLEVRIPNFPLSYVLLISGYTLILFIEKIVVDNILHKKPSQPDSLSERDRIKTMAEVLPFEDIDLSKKLLNSSEDVDTDSKNVNQDNKGKVAVDNHHHEHHHEHDHFNMIGTQNASTAYILMIALSIHAIFEGLALGCQYQQSDLIVLFIGIIVHKWAEAVAIACSFIKSDRKKKSSLVFLIIFSLASPMGVIIGTIVADTDEFVSAILCAIAAGTFLYVACHEIIAEEFGTHSHRISKFILFFVGLVLITSLAALDHD